MLTSGADHVLLLNNDSLIFAALSPSAPLDHPARMLALRLAQASLGSLLNSASSAGAQSSGAGSAGGRSSSGC